MEKSNSTGKDKTFYILLTVCIVVWTAVVALLGTFIYISTKNANVEINNSVVVVGNNNTVVIPEIAKNYNKKVADNKKKSEQITAYSLRVLEATTVWSKDITLDEALELTKKIRKAALNNNLKLEEAFCIVHVESDFRSDAFNRGGKAYGLCQVTSPCLDEYNWKHNTNYTLQDMFNVDKNLEVGFWYYNRLIYHYGSAFGLTTTNEWSLLRDAYIAYNVGITKFSNIGRWGRNELRNGRYPCNMYGSKTGDIYQPYFRFVDKAKIWIELN